MTSPYHNRLPMAYLPASRAVESVGIPPMFRSRVRGLCAGFSDIRDALSNMSQEAAKQAEEAKKAKAALDAEMSWRSSTPILTFTTVEYMFEIGPVKLNYSIYGYNKSKGLVWFSVNGGDVMLRPESDLSNIAEWNAAKNSLPSTTIVPTPAAGAKATGSALPIILGAAYLLLS